MCCSAHGKHPRCSATACRLKGQRRKLNHTIVKRYVLQIGAGWTSCQAASRMQNSAAMHTGSIPDAQPQHADLKSNNSVSIKQ
jgi:hypothetical protein